MGEGHARPETAKQHAPGISLRPTSPPPPGTRQDQPAYLLNQALISTLSIAIFVVNFPSQIDKITNQKIIENILFFTTS
ncbi:hypothetical protein SAMN05421863_104911 [Nitrosomonas communis]|uniref:Uncharacterized protein n=1 Tax=Nitrosomonas communis TaxID=44574 RepID=A0A1I4TCC7_9PROT|nr:hypothetical protein SAMN05421863_104911 [Nitrosomonas communis]